MNSPLLSFHEVSFGYMASRPILQKVSFDLQPGRILAIVGPNGAGKTTLLYLALGWLSAWSGDVLFEQTLLRKHTRRERGRRMALVPQNEHSPFDYSLLEYVLMGRAPLLPPLGMPGEADHLAVQEALQLVGLDGLADQPVPHLSSGEHQLMLLARAIVQQPSLYLLDEPTAHLDLHNKIRLIHMLRQLRNAGSSLLMTNHEPEVVLALADDVLLLEAGKPVLFGPLDQVFTAETLSRLYQIPIRLVEVDGHKQVLWT